MKSLTLLMYKAAEGSLEVRARDLDSKWLTALAALDDDTYALADNSHNLVRWGCGLGFGLRGGVGRAGTGLTTRVGSGARQP
jgi:hypothetical protein